MEPTTRSKSSESSSQINEQSGEKAHLPSVKPDPTNEEVWKKNDKSWASVYAADLETQNVEDYLNAASELLYNIMLPLLHAKLLEKNFWGSDASKNCRNLLSENEGLRDLLAEGIKAEDFTEIRRLAIFRSKPAPRKVVSAILRYAKYDTIPSPNAVIRAWNREYVGRSHIDLFENINRMDTSGGYSNTVSILQSSGTGKSRMVDELAKLIFTIPINIRNPHEAAGSAYPDSDENVHKLLRSTATQSKTQVSHVYSMFLHDLFEAIYDKIANFEQTDTYAELASKWRTFLECQPEGESVTNRQQLYEELHQRYADVETDAQLPRALAAAVESAAAALQKLIRKLEDLVKDPSEHERKMRLVIYIDEADVLKEHWTSYNATQIEILTKCFDELRQRASDRFMVIYISTDPTLSVQPSAVWDASERTFNQGIRLQAPITELPFDCHPDLVSGLQPKSLTCKDLRQLDFISKFGRPLWWTLLEGSHLMLTPRHIIELAQSKLIASDDIFAKSLDKKARLALLDSRLLFNYDFRLSSVRKLQDELITKHIRLAYSIHEARDFVQSGYSSEPFVAEAAAIQINRYKKGKTNPSMVEALTWAAGEGYFKEGDRAELIARYLLLQAFDNAIDRDIRESERNERTYVTYNRDCPLVTFIEELVASGVRTQILDSFPDNIEESEGPKPFREEFKNACVRFTHWVRIADEESVSTEALYAAFVRGMALICCEDQPFINLVIPVLLCGEDEDVVLDESVMTAILIQVKNRNERCVTGFDAEDLPLFPDADSSGRPYIHLIMDLGLQNALPEFYRMDQFEDETVPQSNMRLHPRYNIYLPGCTNRSYTVVDKRQEASFQKIFEQESFLQQYPGRNLPSLGAALNMKPTWLSSLESYKWIQTGDLTNSRSLPDTEEKLKNPPPAPAPSVSVLVGDIASQLEKLMRSDDYGERDEGDGAAGQSGL